MAPVFNLWNLFQYEDCYEFDVTQAESSELQAGTQEWVAHGMQAAGLEVPIRSWEIVPARTAYYTDYPTATSWRDRWTQCWTVRVYPEGLVVPISNRLSSQPAYIERGDPTWDADTGDPRLDRMALVIVDYKGDAALMEQWKQAALAQEDDAQAAIRHYDQQIHQLRLRLTGDLFPDSVKQLDQIVERFKVAGGVTNWRDRLTWLEEQPQISPDIQAWLSQLGSHDAA